MMWEKFSHPKQKRQDQILLGWVLGTDVPGCMLGWALSAEGSNRHFWLFEAGRFTSIRTNISAVDCSQGSDPAGAIT